MTLAAFLGLLAAGRGEVPKWAAWGTLALLLVSNGLVVWTAQAGRQIHHPETRPDFVVPVGDGGGHHHEAETQPDVALPAGDGGGHHHEDEGHPH